MKGFLVCIKKNDYESPFLNSWKRDKKGNLPLLILLFKNRKEGMFMCVLLLVFLNGYGVFHKVNLFSKLRESCSFLLVNKRGNHPLYPTLKNRM